MIEVQVMFTRFLTDEGIEYLRRHHDYKIGKGVKIARSAIIDCKELEIGDNCMISDYAILTGNVHMGNYCHVAHYAHISGSGSDVIMGDHVGIGSRSTIYTADDDYSGNALYTPCPEMYCNKIKGNVIIGDFVMLGWGCTVFPNTQIDHGAHFGRGCMLKGVYQGYGLYVTQVDGKAQFIKDIPRGIMNKMRDRLNESR
jgi:galactoside O-acetyltransferase